MPSPNTALPVIVQTAWLGDAVLSLALIRAAARAANTPVLLVTRPSLAPLFDNDHAIEAIVPFDKRSDDAGPIGLCATAHRLRAAIRNRSAIALMAQGSVRSMLLTTAARIHHRVAFNDAPGHRLATHTVPRLPHRPWDELELLKALYNNAAPHPNDPILARLQHPKHLKQIALCVGSARPTKRPSTPTLGFLARHLLNHGCTVLLMGSANEKPRAREVARRSQGDCIDTTGNSLVEAAHQLSQCTLAIGGDSGLLHLARAVGTDTIVLHGPTPTRPFAQPISPKLGQYKAFTRALPCSPCSPSGPQNCPLGHGHCMHYSPNNNDALWSLVSTTIALDP